MTWLGYMVVGLLWAVLIGIGLWTLAEQCLRWFEKPLTKQQQDVLLMWWAGVIKAEEEGP